MEFECKTDRLLTKSRADWERKRSCVTEREREMDAKIERKNPDRSDSDTKDSSQLVKKSNKKVRQISTTGFTEMASFSSQVQM